MISKLESQLELILLLFLVEEQFDIIEYESDIIKNFHGLILLDGDPNITITGTSVHYPYNDLSFHININRVKTKKIVKELEDGILSEDQLYLAHGKDPFGLNDVREDLLKEITNEVKESLRSPIGI